MAKQTAKQSREDMLTKKKERERARRQTVFDINKQHTCFDMFVVFVIFNEKNTYC